MDVNLYKQTTQFTCAPSSVLMVLNYFAGTSLTKENEIKLWKFTRAKPFKKGCELGIANALLAFGLNCRIISSQEVHERETDICFKYEKIDIRKRELLLKKFFIERCILKKYIEKKGCLIEDRDPKLIDIKKIINDRKPVILIIDDFFINKKRNKIHCPHVVVATGYKNNMFSIKDSWFGEVLLKEHVLKKSMKGLRKYLNGRPAIIEVL